MQSVALNLLAGHGESWGKLSEQSVNGMRGNLPNAEETAIGALSAAKSAGDGR